MNRSASLLVALALAGCASGSDRATGGPWSNRSEPEVRQYLAISLPRIIPVGDTLRARITHLRCLLDVCSGLDRLRSDSTEWSVDSRATASVTPEGLFVGNLAGYVRLTAQLPDTVLVANIEIIPAVSNIAWEPVVETAVVGDTIRLRAVARGPSGEVVAILPAWGVKGSYSHIVRGGADGTIVVPSEPGIVELTASVGHRLSTIRIIVEMP